MNRGPIVLSIDEAEYLLDQLPPPDKDESPMVTKLRTRLQELLTDLRKGAEDVFDATKTTNTTNGTSSFDNDNVLPDDFTQAFTKFENDSLAQYEMHPRFGRYVWDIGDQWYQKWNLVFSMENMWQWSGQIPSPSQDPYSLEMLQPWLDHITKRHNIHPHHRQLLENICDYLFSWQKTNKPLTNAGTSRINTIPFYPPSWFVDKERQNHVEEGDPLAASYCASFTPPYRVNGHTPERWDKVFLKGLTFDPTNEKFDMDPSFIARIIPLYGLTVHFDENTGYSYLMMVMRKASFGNLEANIQNSIPTDYQKPRRQALSIAKAVKDLHWEYIHGNVHPRNILFNFDDTLGELVDATFMQRKKSVPSISSPSSLQPPSSSSNTDGKLTANTMTTAAASAVTTTGSPTPPLSPDDPPLSCMDQDSRHSYMQQLGAPSTKLQNPHHHQAMYSKKGDMSGRWPYVAPEVAQGLTGPTTEADIYSVGVILWQLISRVTFPANAPVDPWVFRIEPIPGVLPEWEQLYADCLAADPAKRPSAYMVYRRLEKMDIMTTAPDKQLASPSPSPSTSVPLSLSTPVSSVPSPTPSVSTSSPSVGTSSALPLSQATLDYIHQRRKEVDEFMDQHQGQFTSPHQRLTKVREDVILTASVTRSINPGLESYPSPVQGFS